MRVKAHNHGSGSKCRYFTSFSSLCSLSFLSTSLLPWSSLHSTNWERLNCKMTWTRTRWDIHLFTTWNREILNELLTGFFPLASEILHRLCHPGKAFGTVRSRGDNRSQVPHLEAGHVVTLRKFHYVVDCVQHNTLDAQGNWWSLSSSPSFSENSPPDGSPFFLQQVNKYLTSFFQFHGAPAYFTDILSYFNLVFTLLFTIECAFKLVSFGPRVSERIQFIQRNLIFITSCHRHFFT